MKTFVKKTSSVKFGLLAFVAGFVSLFLPHFSGWNEIVFPELAWVGVFPYIFWVIFFAISLGLSLVYILLSFLFHDSARNKVTFIFFSVGLIALFLGIHPDFFSGRFPGVNQRVNSFALGGQTKILWAGGIETIRNDALLLLNVDSDDEGWISSELWPNSLRRLDTDGIKIDKETQSILIYIEKAHLFDPDKFVYVITYNLDPTSYIKKENDYRFWQLGEGVYFFQTW